MALSPSRTSFGHEASPGPARGPAVPVLVVTTDDGLWARVSAAIPGLKLEQFDDPADLVERWNAARAAVVLVDARGIDIGRAVERLQTHSVALVPVAYVDEDTAAAAATLERQKALYDHVTSALDPGTTLATFERAGEEALARSALVPPGVSHSITSPPPRAPAGGSSRTVYIAGGAAVACALAAAAVWFTRSPAPTPEAPRAAAPNTEQTLPSGPTRTAPAETPAEAGASIEEVEQRLAQARAAMRDKHYIDPEDDNALLHYRNVLAIDPENGEARQGIDRLAEVLIGRAESAMTARDYSAALRAVEVARNLKPDHPRLAALDAQVGQRLQELSLAQIQAALQANSFERAAALIRQAERSGAISAAQAMQLRTDIGRRQASSEVQDLARLAQARIAQGRLLEPANDSAKSYLARLQARGGDAVDAAARLRTDYVRRLIAEARAASGRGATADFDALAAELRANGVSAAQIAQLQREPAVGSSAANAPKAVDSARIAQLAQERLAQRRLLAPEGDNALHYFRALQGAEARHPALPGLRDALGTALVDQARAAYDGGRASEAQLALDAARDVGVPAATIAAVQAAGTAPRAPVVTQQPRLARALNPQYPARAVQDGVEGWVDVEFTVNTEGDPQNVRAVASEPARTFDQAAVNAVRRARFEPARTADGTPVQMNSRLRVRFALQNEQKGR